MTSGNFLSGYKIILNRKIGDSMERLPMSHDGMIAQYENGYYERTVNGKCKKCNARLSY